MDDSIGVLVFTLLQVPLNLLWIKQLQAIWLQLKPIVKIWQKADKILDGLAPLLFQSEGIILFTVGVHDSRGQIREAEGPWWDEALELLHAKVGHGRLALNFQLL